jgi:hypothetical protein
MHTFCEQYEYFAYQQLNKPKNNDKTSLFSIVLERIFTVQHILIYSISPPSSVVTLQEQVKPKPISGKRRIQT